MGARVAGIRAILGIRVVVVVATEEVGMEMGGPAVGAQEHRHQIILQ